MNMLLSLLHYRLRARNFVWSAVICLGVVGLGIGIGGSGSIQASQGRPTESGIMRAAHAWATLEGEGLASDLSALSLRSTLSYTQSSRLFLPLVRRIPLLATRAGYAATSGVLARAEAGDPILADLLSLRAGWYLNWGTAQDPPRPHGMEFAQMIRVHQELTCPLNSPGYWDRTICPYKEPYSYLYWPDSASIQQIAQRNPGSLWLIGNEIDRRDWPGGRQDEILPEVYAEAYHELYTLIKDADPTAKVAIGGVVQTTPLRMLYLDRIWNAYLSKYGTTMPVDVWNMHVFVLPEKRNSWGADIPVGIDLESGAYLFRTDVNGNPITPMPEHIELQYVEEQVLRFRNWMKAKGEQEKPLIITEYGVLLHNWMMGFPDSDPQPVVDYLMETFDYFLEARDCDLGYTWDGCRLVQRWVWFSLDTPVGFNPHAQLLDPTTGALSPAGQAFRDWTNRHLPELLQRPYP